MDAPVGATKGLPKLPPLKRNTSTLVARYWNSPNGALISSHVGAPALS